jgi:hypothetical protein
MISASPLSRLVSTQGSVWQARTKLVRRFQCSRLRGLISAGAERGRPGVGVPTAISSLKQLFCPLRIACIISISATGICAQCTDSNYSIDPTV